MPGFLFGRRHAALSGSPAYFNFYLVESPTVLTSKPYLERLDNPTPMTKKIMSEVFLNMNRTVCHRTLRRGAFRGAYAVTVRFNDQPDVGALTALAETLVQDAGVAACEIWTAVDPAGQPVSMEEKLRGGDKKIKACLMVDTLRQKQRREARQNVCRKILPARKQACSACSASSATERPESCNHCCRSRKKSRRV